MTLNDRERSFQPLQTTRWSHLEHNPCCLYRTVLERSELLLLQSKHLSRPLDVM